MTPDKSTQRYAEIIKLRVFLLLGFTFSDHNSNDLKRKTIALTEIEHHGICN